MVTKPFYFKQYSYSLIPVLLGLYIYSTNFDRSNIANIPVDYRYGSGQRISFNERVSYNLGAINRAQQAYFFELAKFASSYEELAESGFSLSEENNYQLTIESKNNSAFIYALPKENYALYKEWSGLFWTDAKEPLYSYVSGIAYLEDNNSFQSILCVSRIVGEQKLEKPKIVEGKFICPQDTEEIP